VDKPEHRIVINCPIVMGKKVSEINDGTPPTIIIQGATINHLFNRNAGIIDVLQICG
jgi:hypothetical protein